MKPLFDLLSKLVSFPSITPEDMGCQDYIQAYLEELGFSCQRYDVAPVSNLFARIGQEAPLLVFAGHTDVVSPGNLDKWQSLPFVLEEREGMLYGRGSADMKGSIACMMLAAARFIKDHPNFKGSLGFLITSGEEGDQHDLGTPIIMAKLKEQGTHIDYCILGEPSSHSKFGDMIKVGRRGSLTANVILHGIQGHVAYPHKADNPVHRIAPALAELVSYSFDEGNAFFPATSLQITALQSGGHANNIIPGELSMQLNIRFSTEQTVDSLKNTIENIWKRHAIQPEIDWQLGGLPFLTSKSTFLETCVAVIEEKTGLSPELSTSGGTSDGRYIAPYGVELIELGPVNDTIHQINESVAMEDLLKLEEIYYSIAAALFGR